MINADFKRQNNNFISFSINGHACYDDTGNDVVCASVTSAVQLTANGITEVISVRAGLDVNENKISLTLPCNPDERAYDFMESLFLHLTILSEDYEGTIKLNIMEVQDNA